MEEPATWEHIEFVITNSHNADNEQITDEKWKQRDLRSPSFMGAALAVEWLNASKGTAAHGRILAVRAELEALRVEHDTPFVGMQEWETCRAACPPSRLRTYRGIYSISPNSTTNSICVLGSTPLKSLTYNLTGRRWWLTDVAKNPRGPQVEIENEVGFPKIRVTEAWVAAALASLAASRELSKVRLCENCRERWLVSIRPTMDRFCNEECREHFHTHSDAYRERKAATQRNYRKKLKDGKLAEQISNNSTHQRR